MDTTVVVPSETDTSTTPGVWAGVCTRSMVGHATDTWATAPPRRTTGRSGKPSPPITIVLPPEREPLSGDTDTIRRGRVGAGAAGEGTTVVVVVLLGDGAVVGADATVVGVDGAVVGVLGGPAAVVGVLGADAAVVGVEGVEGEVVDGVDVDGGGVGGAGVDGVLGAGGGGTNTGTWGPGWPQLEHGGGVVGAGGTGWPSFGSGAGW